MNKSLVNEFTQTARETFEIASNFAPYAQQTVLAHTMEFRSGLTAMIVLGNSIETVIIACDNFIDTVLENEGWVI